MKIINLYEDTEGVKDVVNKHGLSFYIETAKHKNLFDTGAGDELYDNAKTLGVDLSGVDTIVISHGHYDHTGGLVNLPEQAKVFIQSTAFDEFYSHDMPEDKYRYIGMDKSIFTREDLVRLDGDYDIDDELSLYVLKKKKYEIPKTNEHLKIKLLDDYVSDDFKHEQYAVIREKGKTVLITGCAHSGILNILYDYTERFNIYPDVVIGGFHMQKKDEFDSDDMRNIESTAKRLDSTGVKVYTCHCTGMKAYSVMKKYLEDLVYIHCGQTINIC